MLSRWSRVHSDTLMPSHESLHSYTLGGQGKPITRSQEFESSPANMLAEKQGNHNCQAFKSPVVEKKVLESDCLASKSSPAMHLHRTEDENLHSRWGKQNIPQERPRRKGGERMWSQFLKSRRAWPRQENLLNQGGRGCSEPRSQAITLQPGQEDCCVTLYYPVFTLAIRTELYESQRQSGVGI
ncbi:hypothetical protein AAY473_016555 [Plecturocebus cupreus]